MSKSIGTDMLTDFVSNVLARRALSKREQKQNKFLLFWAKAQRAKKALNVSLPIMEIKNAFLSYKKPRFHHSVFLCLLKGREIQFTGMFP